jgi:hypothetical protein
MKQAGKALNYVNWPCIGSETPVSTGRARPLSCKYSIMTGIKSGLEGDK